MEIAKINVEKIADMLEFCHKLNFMVGMVCGIVFDIIFDAMPPWAAFLIGVGLSLIANLAVAKIVMKHTAKTLSEE